MLQKILQKDLTYIRVLFYKLDRLILINLPMISEHFLNIKIESQHFAAPWFLTLFTNVCNDEGYSSIIYDIWDIIIEYGWKGVYRIIIGVLNHYK